MKVIQPEHNPKDEFEYSFDYLVSQFKSILNTLPDFRVGLNKIYNIANAALSAFSVFFYAIAIIPGASNKITGGQRVQ